MNQFTSKIIEALVQKQDITEVFREYLEKAVNTLLATELTVFLDYEKYDRIGFNSGNSRNGSYSRTLHTEYGDLNLQIPRDRNGEFKQQTVAPYQRSNDTLEATVIHLFQKGITITEIAHLIEKMYGHHYTPQTISNMTKAVSEQVEAFNQRPLHTRYVCVYLDATYIAVRRETVSKEAVYIAVGICEDGSKEVLAYTIAPTESTYNWQELLEELKERGVEDVLLFISDGLKSMADAILSVFPKAKYQTCLVHVARNLSHKVRVEDRQEVCDDFKNVYKADCLESGQEALDAFCSKWQKSYPKVVKSLKENQHLLTFYSFPKDIWRSIYSTNLIESFNKQIKKYTKRKEQFPNEEAMERFLVSQFEDYNQRYATRCHIGFNKARAALVAMFEELES
ncbi:IS256 family transposase [Bacillus pseudomycoides]|uniref:Mutator family transposase n=1 Tax=Bacillus pseudomycoides TaxID=64104 RepID=A0AA91VFA2_9BACI|nr:MULTISPECIES: IS256 family transposase [Bacillus]PEB54350.1 IS256 family transposase [Bacillus sp. AFS098217]PED83969.1 IS256 family transposase [Bacillus pseudomycoides]PEU16629.1 IS256 family transposase [Bacillus sp. AFS019443]